MIGLFLTKSIIALPKGEFYEIKLQNLFLPSLRIILKNSANSSLRDFLTSSESLLKQ